MKISRWTICPAAIRSRVMGLGAGLVQIRVLGVDGDRAVEIPDGVARQLHVDQRLCALAKRFRAARVDAQCVVQHFTGSSVGHEVGCGDKIVRVGCEATTGYPIRVRRRDQRCLNAV